MAYATTAGSGMRHPLGTLTTVLDGWVQRSPDSRFLEVEGEVPLSYGEFQARTLKFAGGLRALGVERGTFVATLLENCIEDVYTWFACASLGAVFVPLNPAMRGTFLERQLRKAQAKVLITDSTHMQDVARIEDRLDTLQTIVTVDGSSVDEPLVNFRRAALAEVWDAGDAYPASLETAAGWSDPGVILFTGGTTGESKGCVLSQNYLTHMSDLYGRHQAMGPGDVMYSGLPLFHLTGLVCTIGTALVSGAGVVLDNGFSVSGFWNRVREVGASHTMLIGAMVQMLWDREADDSECDNPLQTVAANPIPVDLVKPFQDRYGVTLVAGYGTTETGTVSLSSPTDPPSALYGARVLPEYDVAIVDDEGEAVPRGQAGEMLFRPRDPHIVFEGYLDDPAATQAISQDFWLHTGDIGVLDEGGYLRFIDRKKDYLRRRGENVSSFEVEQAIREYGPVADVAVVGVRSELPEDEVKACVVLKSGSSVTAEDVFDHCVEAIPHFAVPRFIEIYDELPLTPAGRVHKIVLREQHALGRSWDREQAGRVVPRERRGQRKTTSR